MFASSRSCAIFLPPPKLRMSTAIWWDLVKPFFSAKTLTSFSYRYCPAVWAFFTICLASSAPKSFISKAAMLRAGSLPRWVLEALRGKTANWIFFTAFSHAGVVGLPIMTPPCGPGKVLWVEEVIKSAPSRRGSWNSPPAIKPRTWEAS